MPRNANLEKSYCLGKTGELENVMPLNQHHFAVGEIYYRYVIRDSNWTVHKGLDKEAVTDKIAMKDAIYVHERAIIGDIVSKYILLYLGNYK